MELKEGPDEIISRGRSCLLRRASRILGLGDELTEEPCPVYGDAPPDMTSSRLLARFLSRFAWYRPRRPGGDDGGPNLDAAWAHYERRTLARYYTDRPGMHRAEEGEITRPTSLYPVWGTSITGLSDFGVSARMYFATLLTLAAFLFVAGSLNVPLLVYFWRYSEKDGIPMTILGSAICDTTEWVECETCNENPEVYPAYRLDGQNVLVNACDFESLLVPGLLSYGATISLLVLFGVWFDIWQKRAEVSFDEDIQTASDYSIKVKNPPPDATDPEEWRHFFSSFADQKHRGGEVVVCTIALDNADLIRALTDRRRLLKKLSKSLPVGIDMMDESAVAEAVADCPVSSGFFGLSFLSANARDQYDKIKDLEKKIKWLVEKREYRPVAVFVTFDTERAQRNALHVLTTGKIDIWRNKLDTYTYTFSGNVMKVRENARSIRSSIAETFSLDMKTEQHSIRLACSEDATSDVGGRLLFRGRHVLEIKEAVEPNDVCWRDLQIPYRVQAIQFFGTTIVLIAFMTWSGVFINNLVKNESVRLPIFIVIINAVIPNICEVINKFESHSTEGHRQCSLYVKIALFRWFNSAIVLSIIFGFIDTISIEDGGKNDTHSLIYSVAPIITAELFMGPFIKVMDISGNFDKHVLAPRARDQNDMNHYFSGSPTEPADLYTDATKVLFVALFYSAIFPGALFLGSLALLIQFASSKFCLLRQWQAAPDVGNDLARLSRNYFFPMAKIAHVVMSAYWWSGYPYDQVCGRESDDSDIFYCSQDLFRQGLLPLPRYQPDGSKWMTDSQEIITALYGWTGIVFMACAAVFVAKKIFWSCIAGLFVSTYEPSGMDQKINFSKVKHLYEVRGYIPQSKDSEFSHPLLECDLTCVDEDLVGWKDHLHGFAFHNLFNDACHILGGRPVKPAFSIVKQWNSRR